MGQITQVLVSPALYLEVNSVEDTQIITQIKSYKAIKQAEKLIISQVTREQIVM